MCSNWSPWQEFETLPCLLLVDVVVLMSSSVETRPLIPCHPPPLASLLHCLDCWLLSIRHPRLTLLWQKYVTCYQGSAVVPEGTRQTVKQTAVLRSRRCFSPLQIALGIFCLSLSRLHVARHFSKKNKRLAQSASRRRSGEVFAAGSEAPLVGWVLCRF